MQNADGFGFVGNFFFDSFCGRVERAFIDIAKDDVGSPVDNGICRSDKRTRRHDDLVAQLNETFHNLKETFGAGINR